MNDPVSTCRRCGAMIIWCVTSKGKKMPVDVTPSQNGEFFLFRKGPSIAAIHVASRDGRVGKAVSSGQKRHTSHFSTCPLAGSRR